MSGLIAAIGTVAVAAGPSAYGACQTHKRRTRAASAQKAQTDVANRQVDLAEQLQQESQPLRDINNAQLYGFMTGNGAIPANLYTPPPADYGLNHFLTTGELPTAVDLAPTTAAN